MGKTHVAEKDPVEPKQAALEGEKTGDDERTHEAADLDTAAQGGDPHAQEAVWSAGDGHEHGGKKKQQHLDHHHAKHKGAGGISSEKLDKTQSARFEADPILEAVAKGEKEVKKGDSGLHVTKIQTAFSDVGYDVDINGTFDDKTEAAVKKFQTSYSVEEFGKSGVIDQATMSKLHNMYGHRFPYLAAAQLTDPKDQGADTRDLSDDEKKAAYEALAAPLQASEEDKAEKKDPKDLEFDNEIDGKFWDKQVDTSLTLSLNRMYESYYVEQAKLRKHIGTKEEKDHFHEESVLDNVAAESKREVDGVYAGVAVPKNVKDFTFDNANLVDQWDDEEQTNKELKEKDQTGYDEKVNDALYYYLNNDDELLGYHTAHKANLAGEKEQKLLKPILERLTDTEEKKKAILDIDVGWGGASAGGTIYLQRFKEKGKDASDSKEKNRVQLWELFHTCIHEYLHALAHEDYSDYADELEATDSTRSNTLNEGFCDFFTVNVRNQISYSEKLQKAVEQDFHTDGASPVKGASTYDSMAEAEQVISIVGIHNAHAGYFRGELDKLGLS